VRKSPLRRAFLRLSIPVVGAGIALSEGVSAANTVLGFGIAVALGVALSGWALLRRRASSQGGGVLDPCAHQGLPRARPIAGMAILSAVSRKEIA
jgi:hypothetical protein